MSRQTVDRALAQRDVAQKPAPTVARPAKARASSKKATPPAAPSSPADLDELRALMAELARGLAAQAREAHGRDDAAAYATLAGKAQSAVLALAKLSPEAAEAEHDGIFVTHEDMAKAAAAGRVKILERVARRARGAA